MVRAQRLKPFPLFARLSERSKEQLAQHCERRHYDKHQTLATQGRAAAAFFLVEYGRVKVFRSNPDGREQVLHLVEPWQSFAEVAVLSLETYPASAQAIEDSAVIVVPRDPFLALVAADAAAARAMLAGQAMWIRRLIDQNASLVLDEVVTRLARYLVVYADDRGVGLADGARLDLNVKKTVIAAQIGTVPETLARNLKKLCDLGVLEREGKSLRVLNAAELQRIAFPAD